MIALALALALQARSPAAAPPSVTDAAHPGLERIAAETSAALAGWDRRVTAMIRAGTLAPVEERRTDDRRDQWFQQVAGGVPVIGTEVWRRQEAGRTTGLGGVLFRDVKVPAAPAITPDDAVRLLAEKGPDGPGPSLPPALRVLPLDDGTYALVYCVRVFTSAGLSVHYVDAMSGEIVRVDTEPGPPDHSAPPAGAGGAGATTSRAASPTIRP